MQACRGRVHARTATTPYSFCSINPSSALVVFWLFVFGLGAVVTEPLSLVPAVPARLWEVWPPATAWHGTAWQLVGPACHTRLSLLYACIVCMDCSAPGILLQMQVLGRARCVAQPAWLTYSVVRQGCGVASYPKRCSCMLVEEALHQPYRAACNASVSCIFGATMCYQDGHKRRAAETCASHACLHVGAAGSTARLAGQRAVLENR